MGIADNISWASLLDCLDAQADRLPRLIQSLRDELQQLVHSPSRPVLELLEVDQDWTRGPIGLDLEDRDWLSLMEEPLDEMEVDYDATADRAVGQRDLVPPAALEAYQCLSSVSVQCGRAVGCQQAEARALRAAQHQRRGQLRASWRQASEQQAVRVNDRAAEASGWRIGVRWSDRPRPDKKRPAGPDQAGPAFARQVVELSFAYQRLRLCGSPVELARRKPAGVWVSFFRGGVTKHIPTLRRGGI